MKNDDLLIKDPPKKGNQLLDWTVCSTDTCSIGGAPTDPADPASRIISCVPRDKQCDEPCWCRLFSWKSGMRWWDSDNDVQDHGETGENGIGIDKADFRVREYLCVCVRPVDPNE